MANPDLELAMRIGDTQLDPLEEQLFRSWMKANGLLRRREEPEDVKPSMDYRGLFKDLGGQVFPRRKLKEAANRLESQKAADRLLEEGLAKSAGPRAFDKSF